MVEIKSPFILARSFSSKKRSGLVSGLKGIPKLIINNSRLAGAFIANTLLRGYHVAQVPDNVIVKAGRYFVQLR
jgi:hypothetical protein